MAVVEAKDMTLEMVDGESALVVVDQSPQLPSVPDELDGSEAMFWREQMLVKVSRDLTWNFLVAGKMLSEIVASGYLQQAGETMAEFLASRSIGFSDSVASKLMKVYRVFVEAHNVEPAKVAEVGDYEKAYKAANLVAHGMDVEEALAQAKTLSRSDMTAVVREQRGDDDVNQRVVKARVRKWVEEMSPDEQVFLATLLAEVRAKRDTVRAVLPELKYVTEHCTFREVVLLEQKLQEALNGLAD